MRGFLPPVVVREEMGAHYLEWRQGGRPCRMELRKKELFIGRRSDSDIVLTDPYVSRRHARLLHQDRVYRVIDLNSTHGTFVNGNRVRERVLEAGDKIRMGPGPSEFSYTGL
ncbi:MAG: FHA domain-containing protein, partial [Candidatus Aminicenantes bacterium]|nr:FHA domain-containing protein [Candidatus Aminicenantes bacterium]